MGNTADSLRITLQQRTANYTPQEKANISYDYLAALVAKMADGTFAGNDELPGSVSTIIDALPEKQGAEKLKFDKKLLNNIANLKTLIMKTYKLVAKGYYKSVFLPLGIAMGMPLGLPLGSALGNVALGLPLGIPLGLAIGLGIGTYLDKKAETEGRAL